MRTFFSLLFLGIALAAKTQDIYFKFTNSTNAQYPLSSIRSITYSGNSMNLNMVSGSTDSIAIDTINNFNYRSVNVNTAIKELSIPDAEVSIYPNPSSGKVNITFNMLAPSNIKIEFISITGEVLNSFNEQGNLLGKQTIVLNPTDYQGIHLPTGVYICRISTAQNAVVKKLIITNN